MTDENVKGCFATALKDEDRDTEAISQCEEIVFSDMLFEVPPELLTQAKIN